MPNVIVGWTMTCIPPCKFAVVSKTAGKGESKKMDIVTFSPAKHALLRNAHVNWKRCKYP